MALVADTGAAVVWTVEEVLDVVGAKRRCIVPCLFGVFLSFNSSKGCQNEGVSLLWQQRTRTIRGRDFSLST